jgi:hypothetical protein
MKRHSSFPTLLLVIALFTQTWSLSAQAQVPEIEVAALGGAHFHLISRGDDSTLAPELSGGTSWILGASLGVGNLESGLLIARKNLISSSTQSESTSWSSIEVPLLYRFGFWPVTLGVGGYASFPIASEGRGTQWGALIGPRVFFPGGILLDARFAWGFTPDATQSTSSSLQVMLGYSFL